jgi:hypothetical protein
MYELSVTLEGECASDIAEQLQEIAHQIEAGYSQGFNPDFTLYEDGGIAPLTE